MVRNLTRRGLMKVAGGASLTLALPGLLSTPDGVAAEISPGEVPAAHAAAYLAVASAVAAIDASEVSPEVSWRLDGYRRWYGVAGDEDRRAAGATLDWVAAHAGWSADAPARNMRRLRDLLDVDPDSPDAHGEAVLAVGMVTGAMFVGGPQDRATCTTGA